MTARHVAAATTVGWFLACSGLPAETPACAAGESWVPDRNACVCIDQAVCGPKPGEACIGTWVGELTDNRSSYTATITLTVTAPSEPSIEDPRGGRCGQLHEKWTSEGNCEMRFDTCTVGDKVVAVAHPLPVMDCDRSNLELDCATGAFRRVELSDGYSTMGTLRRAP